MGKYSFTRAMETNVPFTPPSGTWEPPLKPVRPFPPWTASGDAPPKRRTFRQTRSLRRFLPAAMCFAFFLLVFTGGCAGVQLEELKEVRAGRWPEHEEKDGVVLFCRAVRDPEESSFYFGLDLPSAGFLPLVVYMENRGSDPVTVRPEKIRLLCEDGSILKPVPWNEVYSTVSFSALRALPGFVLGVIPGFVILSSVSTANKELRHAYHRQALQETSLAAGECIQGVIFVRPEKGAAIKGIELNGADLRLRCTRRTAGSTVPLDLCFHFWEKQQ